MNSPRTIIIDKTNTAQDHYAMFMTVLETAIGQINQMTEDINSDILLEAAKDFIITECKNDVFIQQINMLFLVGTLVKVKVEGVSEEESGRREPICFAIYDNIEDELVIMNLTDVDDFDFIQRLFGSFKKAFKKIEKNDVKYVDATDMTYSEAILHYCRISRKIELHKDDIPVKGIH